MRLRQPLLASSTSQYYEENKEVIHHDHDGDDVQQKNDDKSSTEQDAIDTIVDKKKYSKVKSFKIETHAFIRVQSVTLLYLKRDAWSNPSRLKETAQKNETKSQSFRRRRR